MDAVEWKLISKLPEVNHIWIARISELKKKNLKVFSCSQILKYLCIGKKFQHKETCFQARKT